MLLHIFVRHTCPETTRHRKQRLRCTDPSPSSAARRACARARLLLQGGGRRSRHARRSSAGAIWPKDQTAWPSGGRRRRVDKSRRRRKGSAGRTRVARRTPAPRRPAMRGATTRPERFATDEAALATAGIRAPPERSSPDPVCRTFSQLLLSCRDVEPCKAVSHSSAVFMTAPTAQDVPAHRSIAQLTGGMNRSVGPCVRGPFARPRCTTCQVLHRRAIATVRAPGDADAEEDDGTPSSHFEDLLRKSSSSDS